MVQNMYLWFSLRNKDDFLLFFVFKVFRTSLEIQFLRDQLKINLKDFSFKVKDFKFKSITSKSQKAKKCQNRIFTKDGFIWEISKVY